MKDPRLQILNLETAKSLWGYLRPMFDASCHANEVCETEIEVDDILVLMAVDQCTVLALLDDGVPVFALALQFHKTNGHRGVNILTMGGSHLLTVKALYWDHFLDWLRANKVKFLDAYVPTKRRALYEKRLGFDRSCSFIRKVL